MPTVRLGPSIGLLSQVILLVALAGAVGHCHRLAARDCLRRRHEHVAGATDSIDSARAPWVRPTW